MTINTDRSVVLSTPAAPVSTALRGTSGPARHAGRAAHDAGVRRPSARLGLLASLLVLAGCGSLAPAPQNPQAPVPGEFAHARPASATGQSADGQKAGPGNTAVTSAAAAADISWKQFFVSPALQQLIQTALDNNRDLRLAALNVERTQAAYRIQRADRLPSVNGSFQLQRQPSVLTGEQTSTLSLGLGVTQYELDFFGRVKNLTDAALASYMATEEAQRTAQINLVAGVANAYLGLQSLDEQLALTRATLKTREESQKLTHLQYRNGAASDLDVKQADSLVYTARTTLAQLQRQRDTAYDALVLLLGQQPPAELLSVDTHENHVELEEVPAGLPSDLLTRRPDIRQAELQLRSAEANIGAARAAFFPRITLTATAGMGSSQLDDLFNHGKFIWTINPAAVLPIFDYGRNRANLDVARVDQKIAITNYEKAIQTAFSEVSDALANRRGLIEQLDAQKSLVKTEGERLELANLRYRSGVSSYFDVLDAQRSHFTAQQSLISARAEQRQNLVELYKVLGGGWK